MGKKFCRNKTNYTFVTDEQLLPALRFFHIKLNLPIQRCVYQLRSRKKWQVDRKKLSNLAKKNNFFISHGNQAAKDLRESL